MAEYGLPEHARTGDSHMPRTQILIRWLHVLACFAVACCLLIPPAGAGQRAGGQARRRAGRHRAGVRAGPAVPDLPADRAAGAVRDADVAGGPGRAAHARRAGLAEPGGLKPTSRPPPMRGSGNSRSSTPSPGISPQRSRPTPRPGTTPTRSTRPRWLSSTPGSAWTGRSNSASRPRRWPR